MTEFGLATVFGSVCFCVTFVPAFAYLTNFGVKNARPALTQEELDQNKSLMSAFSRDMSFILVGLGFYYYILATETIKLSQCVFLLVLFGVYIVVVMY